MRQGISKHLTQKNIRKTPNFQLGWCLKVFTAPDAKTPPPLNPPQRGGMHAIESFLPPIGGELKGGNLLKYAETNYGEYFMTVTNLKLSTHNLLTLDFGLSTLDFRLWTFNFVFSKTHHPSS